MDSSLWMRIGGVLRRPPRAMRARAHFLRGQAESAKGHVGAAIEAFRRALALEPESVGSRIALANMLSARGEHTAAVSELETVIRAQPQHAQAHAMKGQIEAAQGRIGNAIETFRTVLALEPGAVDSRIGLANLLSAQGEHAAAVSELETVIVAQPQHAQAHAMKGQIEAVQGRTAAAIESFRRALVLEPENAGSRVALASMLCAQGEHSAALSELESAIRAEPRNVQARATKAQIEAAQGRIGAAIASFEACIDIDPDHANAHESLAHLYRVEHRAAEAVRALRSWTARHPADERAWRDLGQSLWEESEQRRNSSIFTDAEDGCSGFEAVLASAASEPLSRAAEMWALQVAAQRSVLGRLDALMTMARYHASQGRMRVMALNLVKSGRTRFPRPALPPPAEIPPAMRDAFTMQGRATWVSGSCDSTLPAECCDVLDDAHLLGFMHHNFKALPESMQSRARGLLRGYETSDDMQTRRAFAPPAFYELHKPGRLAQLGISESLEGVRAAVVGEESPFLTSVCVAGGAWVDLVHIGSLECSASLVRAVELLDWLANPATYDLIACPGLVASWGLGRHGEPLDPDGDRTLLGLLRAKLAPNGRLAVSLPIGRDRVIFNATRVYGPERLPKLLAGLDPIAPASIEADLLGGRRVVRSFFVVGESPRSHA